MASNYMKNKTITIDFDTVKFFVGPPSESTRECIFKESIRRAYSDMSRRTLRLHDSYRGDSKDANKNRADLKEKLVNQFLADEKSVLAISSQEDYDNKHFEMCSSISDIFAQPDHNRTIPITKAKDYKNQAERKECFTMGQAQKVVNMAWKYVYLFYQYYNAMEGAFAKQLADYEKIILFLHAPIDNLVIGAAAKLGVKRPDWPWSQLSYCEYMDFQKKLRETLPKDTPPFIWELENWPFSTEK